MEYRMKNIKIYGIEDSLFRIIFKINKYGKYTSVTKIVKNKYRFNFVAGKI